MDRIMTVDIQLENYMHFSFKCHEQQSHVQTYFINNYQISVPLLNTSYMYTNLPSTAHRHCIICIVHTIHVHIELQCTYMCRHPLTCGAVAQRVERWTCDQQVVGSNPTRGKVA